MAIEKIGYDEIEVTSDLIYTTNIQARQLYVNKNVQNLVQSIKTQGLFSPILVIKTEDGKYELISGQRRMRAFRDYLSKENPQKFEKIPAFVYKNTMEEWEKKAMSINDNSNQEPLSEEDQIASVTVCFNEFKSIKTTSQKTGISEHHVRNYVKYDRLPQILKTLRDEGSIELRIALEVANLFGFDSKDVGDVPEEEIRECAMLIRTLNPKQRKYVREIKKEEPAKPLDVIIELVRKRKVTTREIKTQVASETYACVETFQQKEKIYTIPIATSELIEEGLDVNEI